MTKNQQTSNSHRNRFRIAFRSFADLASSLSLAVLLAGCAGNMPSNFGVPPTSPSGVVHYTGTVYGGQQPVSGATMQIYTVGTTGLKSASTALIAGTYTTDANGGFSIPAGAYSCTGATQVYIVAAGGNAGSGANANLNLVAALGSCAALTPTTSISINELTTVAAAYALAPFAADLTHIGASGSNPTGLVNAFANAAALVNTTDGAVGGAALPAGTVVPTSELDTLANILASCVNTNGSASQCSTLFSATGGTETFSAALGIAKNPGATAITGLYSLSSPTAPFQPSMASQPNDFTVALTFNANGGFATPYGIAIDASGDPWITNETGTTLTELSPTGSVLGTGSQPLGAQGVAIARTGTIWVANPAYNQVTEYNTSAVSIGSTTTAGGVDAPSAIAIDGTNNVWLTNFNGNSVTGFTSGFNALSGSPFTGNGNISVPSGVAIDINGNVYVTSGNGDAIKLTSAGAYSATYTDNTLQGPVSLAVDTSSHVLLTGFTTGTVIAGAVSEFNSAGTSVLTAPVSSGISSPAGIASDGTSFWIANSVTSGSLAQLAFGSATSTSPATGFGSLNTPVGVAVDGSGSVWTTNSGSNTVSQFIGLAVPVTTPLAANSGPAPL